MNFIREIYKRIVFEWKAFRTFLYEVVGFPTLTSSIKVDSSLGIIGVWRGSCEEAEKWGVKDLRYVYLYNYANKRFAFLDQEKARSFLSAIHGTPQENAQAVKRLVKQYVIN